MNKKKIAIIVVSLLILGGVVAAIIFFTKKERKNQMKSNRLGQLEFMTSPLPEKKKMTNIIPTSKNNTIGIDESMYENTTPTIVSEVAIENANGVPDNWVNIPLEEIFKIGWKTSSTSNQETEATFYTDCNYGGKGLSLGVGRYNYAKLMSTGIGNDSISSVKVPTGLKVILYEHDFAGRKLELTENVPCLVDKSFNDFTTSLEIVDTTSTSKQEKKASFYSDCNYGGKEVSLGVGSYNYAKLMSTGIGNDSVSSVKVPTGLNVILFEHDFAGRKLALTENVPCLVDKSFNDFTSSLEIVDTTTPTSTKLNVNKMPSVRIFVFFKPIAQLLALEVRIFGDVKEANLIYDYQHVFRANRIDKFEQRLEFGLKGDIDKKIFSKYTNHIIIEIWPNSPDFAVVIPVIKIR